VDKDDVVLKVEHVDKIYNPNRKKRFQALKDINFDVHRNEFVCIVGPSGCGKSTLLRMLAGLNFPTSGNISFNGEEIVGPSAERGMVFQSYTLFPWMTVRDNIGYGLKLKGMSKGKQLEITEKYLRVISLSEFAGNYPKELSGGMKQRVAIARALANSPEVLLMDEPFGALDPFTKASMQLLLRDIWQSSRQTIVFITHDIEEAVFLATKIFVMKAAPGSIEQEVNIELPEIRALDIKDTAEFIKIRRNINGMMNRRIENDKADNFEKC
jgi:NitT/TauT family transport system ATP-binding protein